MSARHKMEIPDCIKKVGMIAILRRGEETCFDRCKEITRIDREGSHLRVFFDGINSGGWAYNEDGTMWFSDNPLVPKTPMDSDIVRIITKKQRIQELEERIRKLG